MEAVRATAKLPPAATKRLQHIKNYRSHLEEADRNLEEAQRNLEKAQNVVDEAKTYRRLVALDLYTAEEKPVDRHEFLAPEFRAQWPNHRDPQGPGRRQFSARYPGPVFAGPKSPKKCT